MKWYKRLGITALAASLLLLTACAQYGTNIPEEYKGFFDYTFNGDYEIVLDEEGVVNADTNREQGYRCWSVTDTDKHGAELIDDDKAYYQTQEWYDAFETHAFVTSQMRTIGEQKLWDKILSDHLDVGFVQGKVNHQAVIFPLCQ